ncbi:competence protein ComFB [Caldanaerobius fijiensis DSM 17918]|uniref:Competence protein ComFB n=1 Tax=Caldanaerobius fijiensis DSM 17918 TaxID=1121256 RepID=A0A1M4U4T4_9THEO|nr:late competence development ComFB family protein [Caldanaerobius fijiensis]SHE51547.1 competence protein ComFB [Caldanaerobius fijiensis DSM 17918]
MLKVKNCMEDLVFEMIDGIIKDIDVCKCDKCKMDIAALALNNLKPHYVVTPIGEVYTKVNILKQQFEADIISEIVKAAQYVAENPRHDVNILK